MSTQNKGAGLPPNAGQLPVKPAASDGPQEKEKFHLLASRWKRETQFCASRAKMVDHPAYHEIIAMGPPAIPWILEELRKETRYWFAALSAITGEDPVPVTDRGAASKMAEAWLHWGKEHGF